MGAVAENRMLRSRPCSPAACAPRIIKSEGTTAVSTTQMGEAILKELQAQHA